MKKYNKNKNKNGGFTIIEAMIAIFILSVSVASMLGVNATSASFARYANNELTANYLAQEAIDSIRNSRDTIAFQNKIEGNDQSWIDFLNRYGYKSGSSSDRCFDSAKGCYLEMENFNPKNLTTHKTGDDVKGCGSEGCPSLKYNSTQVNSPLFYSMSGDTDSIFSRKVTMEMKKDYEVKITVEVKWNNGNGITKNSSRTLEMYLLNWKN